MHTILDWTPRMRIDDLVAYTNRVIAPKSPNALDSCPVGGKLSALHDAGWATEVDNRMYFRARWGEKENPKTGSRDVRYYKYGSVHLPVYHGWSRFHGHSEVCGSVSSAGARDHVRDMPIGDVITITLDDYRLLVGRQVERVIGAHGRRDITRVSAARWVYQQIKL